MKGHFGAFVMDEEMDFQLGEAECDGPDGWGVKE